jgi:hypothetical protein
MLLLPFCTAHVSTAKLANNTHQLTNKTLVTVQLPFKPSAIKRPPASVNSLSLCITRRHTSPSPISSTTQLHALHALQPKHNLSPRPYNPSSLMPLLTKSIVRRRLNRLRLAHSVRMSSSFTCSSAWCELHVRGRRGRKQYWRQQRSRVSHTTKQLDAEANVHFAD